MNSPRYSAAQNGWIASATCALEKRTIDTPGNLGSRIGDATHPQRGSRRRARVDRRYGSPYGLTSAPTDAHPTTNVGRPLSALSAQPRVAITARTQGSLIGTLNSMWRSAMTRRA